VPVSVIRGRLSVK